MKHSIILKAIVVLLIGIIHSQVSFTQEKKQLSLKEVIDLSLKNSHAIKLNQARILEATSMVREAEERRLPDASISGAYLHLNNPNVDLKLKASNSGSGTATQPVKVSQAVYSIANLTLPIYSGFRIKYGIESARYLAEAAKLDADENREALIENTISAYSNLYKATASVNLVNENLKQSRQRVADFSNLEKNGLLARNDLLKARLQTSNLELSLLDVENNRKIANINMNLMIGLPEQTDIIPDSSIIYQATDEKPIDAWEQLAFQNRKDISALAFRKKSADLAIKSAKGERYPSIALTGGYVAAHVPNLLTVTNAMNIGIGLQYNLSFWKSNTNMKQATFRSIQLEENKAILNDAVRLQVNQAYQDYILSRKKIDVLQQAVEQANENYKITKNKYENSLATTTDLLDADVAQLQSTLNFALSKIDAAVAYNRLLQTAGVLTAESINK